MVWPEGLENNFKGNKGRRKKISEKSCYEENRINHLTYYAWETREKMVREKKQERKEGTKLEMKKKKEGHFCSSSVVKAKP